MKSNEPSGESCITPPSARAQAPAPCLACPWIHEKSLLNSRTKAAAKRGDWFCCHKNMGTCYGAQMVGERLRARDAAHAQEVIERAYGCLWRETGDAGLFVFRARKLLLSLLDKEGQKRGIAWALEQFGEPPAEQTMDVIGPPRGAHAETDASERTDSAGEKRSRIHDPETHR